MREYVCYICYLNVVLEQHSINMLEHWPPDERRGRQVCSYRVDTKIWRVHKTEPGSRKETVVQNHD